MNETISYGDDVTIKVTFNKDSHNLLRESFIRNVKQWMKKLNYLSFNVEYTEIRRVTKDE